jgi:hypothetical protein
MASAPGPRTDPALQIPHDDRVLRKIEKRCLFGEYGSLPRESTVRSMTRRSRPVLSSRISTSASDAGRAPRSSSGAEPDQDREDENTEAAYKATPSSFRKTLILAPQSTTENERNQNTAGRKRRAMMLPELLPVIAGNAVSRPGKEDGTAQQKQGNDGM